MDKGYSLFVDNYYKSVALARYIAKRSTSKRGTLRSDRKGNPHDIKKVKLKKGEFACRRSGSVVVCKWTDKRDALNISNKYINPKMVLLLAEVGIKNKSRLLFAIVTNCLANV